MAQALWVLKLLILLAVNSSMGYPSGENHFARDPEEIGGFFEGDMDLSEEQFLALRSRNGLIARTARWPDKLVFYKIGHEFDPAHKSYILKAIHTLEKASCIRFKEATEADKYYINITAEASGCHSQVGFKKKTRRMNLQIHDLDKGCFRMGTILHEFLHTLGFYHQQSASDRDSYITVVEENILPGMEENFVQQTDTENFGIPYDYDSVLHYSSMAFSKNDQKTIITLDPKAEIGQRVGLSLKDIDKLNTMYLCPMQT